MAALTAFHSRILPMVPGCPEPTVNQAIIDSCIDFCERSHIITRKLDPVFTASSRSEVEFDLPDQSRLVRLTVVKVDGKDIDPSLEAEIDPNGSSMVSGKPRVYGTTDEGTIRLHPVPDQRYKVQAYAALKPSRAATSVDDELFEEWGEFIAAGALYRLLVMGSTWGNPAQAKVYFDTFVVGSNRALIESRRRRTATEAQVQFVRI